MQELSFNPGELKAARELQAQTTCQPLPLTLTNESHNHENVQHEQKRACPARAQGLQITRPQGRMFSRAWQAVRSKTKRAAGGGAHARSRTRGATRPAL